MMTRFVARTTVTLGLAACAMALSPRNAHACGGFFCDGGSQPMPVDQTGEDVLFVMDEGEVEVHIRIDYEGEAAAFAWVVPVLSVPTQFAVGSQQLFDIVKAGSVPSYGFSTTADDCAPPSNDSGMSPGDGDSPNGDGGGLRLDLGSNDPEVLAEAQVGAYDIVVIGGQPDGSTTAQAVFDWLGDNGYQQDEAALPLLGQYLDEGHAFVALKLAGHAGVESLHPIMLRFDQPEPCVPLRLTSIAASDDMAVRTYFLAEHRVVPSTYAHVRVNPLKIDWPNQATNYAEVVTQAVDADPANGRAFVTEYAGPSDVVFASGLVFNSWSLEDFEGTTPQQALEALREQSLLWCVGFDPAQQCAGLHPMVEPLIAEWMLPEDTALSEFLEAPESFLDTIDLDRWDEGIPFAEGIAARVFEPAYNARDALEGHPYLTRMFTTISPHEMTVDPMFYENPDLGEVPNNRTATRRTLCNGDMLWTLPDGREVYVPAGEAWPDLGGDMFWEEEVAQMPSAGAPMLLLDNATAIDALLAEYNAAAGWGPQDADPTPDLGPGADDTRAQGCGCNSGSSGSAMLLCGFALIAMRRRQLDVSA